MSDLRIWLTDDGELEEVRGVLEGSGLSVSRQPPEDASRDGHRPIVMGSPRRIAESASGCPDALRIQVIGAEDPVPDSGALWMRRPIDPHALRSLVDALRFSGEEQRWAPRAAIGRPVRFASRLWMGHATLVDLSVDGCRLVTSKALDEGRHVVVWLPVPPGRRMRRRVAGCVVRHETGVWNRPGDHSVSLVFTSVPLGARRCIQALLEHHSGSRLSAAPPVPTRVEMGTRPGDRERRGAERHVFDRRVIVRRDEGPAVLRGRDLSLGGVRIEPTPGLEVGSSMQLAVHVKPGTTPLVLDACVARDDAEDGLVLTFEGLGARQREYLTKMLGELDEKPRVAAPAAPAVDDA